MRKIVQHELIIGEASQVTMMVRPTQNKIVYDLLGVIHDVDIISNPSMNDSQISDGEGPIIGLGSIVSGTVRKMG